MVSDFIKELLLAEESSLRIERRLLAIHETIKSKIPTGLMDSIPLTITDGITLLNKETMPSMPWMDFYLYNDGPNSVYVIVNGKATGKAPVKYGEVLDVNMEAQDKIQSIILYCDKGETANVRAFAMN